MVAVGLEVDFLDTFLDIPRSGGAGVSLIDNKGMLVYRYPTAQYTWEQRDWLKLYPEMGEALKGKEVVVDQVSGITGERRLVAFTPISSTGWVASCSRAEHEVTAAITKTLLPQAAAMLLVTLAAFGVALGLSRPITASIVKLRNRAQALGRGGRENVGVPSGPEELRDLGDTFNQIAAEVRLREEALRASEQRWATTLSSIGDAVIATDVAGRITFMNSISEELTGWAPAEASQKPVTDVFRIINEHTREEVESPVAKVLREGMVVGLANHTILVRKDGTEVPIDDSGAPIRDKDGNTTGVVLVFRDTADRKAREARITRLTQLYATLSRVNEAIVRARDGAAYTKRSAASSLKRERSRWCGSARTKDRQVMPAASCGPAVDYLADIRIETDGVLGQGPTGTCIREDRPIVNDDFDINPPPCHGAKRPCAAAFGPPQRFPLHCQGGGRRRPHDLRRRPHDFDAGADRPARGARRRYLLCPGHDGAGKGPRRGGSRPPPQPQEVRAPRPHRERTASKLRPAEARQLPLPGGDGAPRLPRLLQFPCGRGGRQAQAQRLCGHPRGGGPEDRMARLRRGRLRLRGAGTPAG